MKPDFTEFLVSPDMSVKQAMARLEQTEERVLFVTGSQHRLLGSITDGDIRRWILAEGGLADPIGDVCNRSPMRVTEPYELEQVQSAMLDLKVPCIPVVDDDTIVRNLLFWDEVFAQFTDRSPIPKVDVPVVIMAGGKGTRLEPFTRILPKPLIPIGDKTVIELIIDTFLKFGVESFYISVNHKARVIKSFFDDLNPNYEVKYLEEQEPLGTAGALQMLASSDLQTFVVTNCDIITKISLPELVEFHSDNQNDVTLVASMMAYKIPYGVCRISNGGILGSIEEKPEYELLVNTGMYVIERSVFEHIDKGQRLDMPELVKRSQSAGSKVGVFPIAENAWLDTGQWHEYRSALESFKSVTG